MSYVVGFGDRFTGRGNFGGDCGAPHCNQWGVSVVAVRQCVNRRSCGLRWCVGSAEALVATRPIPKLLWAILLIAAGLSCRRRTRATRCIKERSHRVHYMNWTELETVLGLCQFSWCDVNETSCSDSTGSIRRIVCKFAAVKFPSLLTFQSNI